MTVPQPEAQRLHRETVEPRAEEEASWGMKPTENEQSLQINFAVDDSRTSCTSRKSEVKAVHVWLS